MEVPGLRVGEHLKGRVRSHMPAGKAFNVSRAMAALGVSSRAMGFLGRDAIAAFDLSARLAGIETDWTPIAGRTRENLTLVDPIGGTATHIRDAGPLIQREDLARLTDDLEKCVGANDLVVFCGSLPPGVTCDDFVALIAQCRRIGALVAVDTSGAALRAAATQDLWLIKPNREELAELLDRPVRDEASLLEAGRELNQRFPIVLVTAGAEGAYAFQKGHIWRATLTLPPDSIRSTVGCGDTFLAGFLAAHQRGLPMADSLADATATAAASALSDLPASFAEADRINLLEQVIVHRQSV